jgi:hypothetical protein
MLWFIYPGEYYLAVPFAAGKLLNEATDAALNDVIAEEHGEAVIAEEVSGDFDGMGQAEGLVLMDVGDVDPPLAATAYSIFDLLGRAANDDANLIYAGIADGFYDTHQDGFVGDGYQLFGVGVGEGAQA